MRRVELQMPKMPVWTCSPTGRIGRMAVTTGCLLPLAGELCWFNRNAFNWSRTLPHATVFIPGEALHSGPIYLKNGG